MRWSFPKSRTFILEFVAVATIVAASPLLRAAEAAQTGALRLVQIAAHSKQERSAIADAGVAIEAVDSASVWAFATPGQVVALEAAGRAILADMPPDDMGEKLAGLFDFPSEDANFHTYAELEDALDQLVADNPNLIEVSSIGQSVEGRDIWAVHFNTSSKERQGGTSSKPGVVFMGNHHAREHLSVEVPLLLAQYLAAHATDPNIAQLLGSRDIWIIPTVNPDGAEYDIATGHYRWWRKNRQPNSDGSYGIDLNRNYGYEWGTGGASSRASDQTYRGPAPFSEPETQAIRDFVLAHDNLKTLLSFHTFSELILYPWGYTYDPVSDSRDRQVFEVMAKTMARWNGYTPEQSSDLYISSGDTTDWAYGEKGIFAFTFELSPRSIWQGGFYPGQKIIDHVFQSNLKPCLYLIDVTGDPYKVIAGNQ